MSLDTYTNLKSEIRDWSHRNDMTDARIDSFIDLAETEMYAPGDDITTGKASDPLQLRVMEARAKATVSTSSRFLALPDNFIEMRRLKLNLAQGDCDVKFRAPDQMILNGVSGIPKFFSVSSQLEFDRTPDSTYTIEMQYLKKEVALSDSNTTNEILTNLPNIYLYGALWALYLWTDQEEKSVVMFSRFVNAIAGANLRDKKGRYGAAPRIRTEKYIP